MQKFERSIIMKTGKVYKTKMISAIIMLMLLLQCICPVVVYGAELIPELYCSTYYFGDFFEEYYKKNYRNG